MTKLVSQEQALVNQLTPAQVAVIGPGSPPTTSPVKYTGPTSSQADKAVAFAYARIGCPYLLRRHRPVRLGLRLLRPDHVSLGGGGRLDPADQRGAVGGPAARQYS